MTNFTEELLIKELKAGIIRRVYFLYGKETFLVQTYANRIMNKCFGGSEPDMLNFVKFNGNPDLSVLSEAVETLPVFADRRVVMLNDFDIEKSDKEELETILRILSAVPEETCVVIYLTGVACDNKKAKTKKLIDCLDKLKQGSAVIEFEKMNEVKTADAIVKRVSRMGCSISKENAVHLARLCLRNYALIIQEIDKLCAYANYTGEITKRSIELLTSRQLESGVFALAGEITSKRGGNAMTLLDELIEQGNEPVAIMSALSITFIDFYRVKLGTAAGKSSQQIVKDFNYAANRAWAVGKASTAASRLTVSRLRECVRVLCDADYKLKSSPIDGRVIAESAVARLLGLC